MKTLHAKRRSNTTQRHWSRVLSWSRGTTLDFLLLPVLIVLAFIVLAEVVDWSDNHAGPRTAWGPLRVWLSQYVGDTQSAIGVLTAIAGSLFTVTSVTFSILLLAVQQGATVLNSQIIDHYLRRQSNRAWFGFFVGVSVFVLITLVQTTHTAAPIFGVTVSTLLGATTLTALVALIYATVDQTRPATVIHSIAEAALAARQHIIALLELTAEPDGEPEGTAILAPHTGYLSAIDITHLNDVLAHQPAARLRFVRAIGDHVVQQTPIAYLFGASGDRTLEASLARGLTIHNERLIATDPAYSLDHIATIGWTAISTAHSDPAVGAIAVHALERLLQVWSGESQRCTPSGQVRYHDPLPGQVIAALESLMVAATESRQHQTFALLLRTAAYNLPHVPVQQQAGLLRLTNTASTLLSEHVCTGVLAAASRQLASACEGIGASLKAQHLRSALLKMETSE